MPQPKRLYFPDSASPEKWSGSVYDDKPLVVDTDVMHKWLREGASGSESKIVVLAVPNAAVGTFASRLYAVCKPGGKVYVAPAVLGTLAPLLKFYSFKITDEKNREGFTVFTR